MSSALTFHDPDWTRRVKLPLVSVVVTVNRLALDCAVTMTPGNPRLELAASSIRPEMVEAASEEVAEEVETVVAEIAADVASEIKEEAEPIQADIKELVEHVGDESHELLSAHDFIAEEEEHELEMLNEVTLSVAEKLSIQVHRLVLIEFMVLTT